MENYLYILPLKTEPFFKIGISSNNYNRVLKHHRTYGLELNNIYIAKGTKKKILDLERILLTLYPVIKMNPFKSEDGATELRHKNDLEQCLIDIEYWSKRLNLTFNKVKQIDIKPLKTSIRKQLNLEDRLLKKGKKAAENEVEMISEIQAKENKFIALITKYKERTTVIKNGEDVNGSSSWTVNINCCQNWKEYDLNDLMLSFSSVDNNVHVNSLVRSISLNKLINNYLLDVFFYGELNDRFSNSSFSEKQKLWYNEHKEKVIKVLESVTNTVVNDH